MNMQEKNFKHFEKLYEKAINLSDRQQERSALNVMLEAKRFAKTNHLANDYLFSCFFITNVCQSLYEPETGIDNATELIAYLESPDKMRKLQNDYNEDEYNGYVHQLSSCAYDNLAVHTALRLGYNSPIVFGAVDDGIHVCRRTGKLECVECFREYSTRITLASGDYEMGEHYARLCALSTARKEARADDRRYIGHRDLIELFIRQGKFQAAFDIFKKVFPFARMYHDPLYAKIELAILAERLYFLSGRGEDFPQFLSENKYKAMPKIPAREEHAEFYIGNLLNESIKKAVKNQFSEAAALLEQGERFLFAQGGLNPWFPVRIARIADLLLARKAGQENAVDVNRLICEVKEKANEANQWSAIQAISAMSEGKVPLNPLGIAFPIDLGPYAAPGTPLSAARLEMTLPVFENNNGLPGIKFSEQSSAAECSSARKTASAENPGNGNETNSDKQTDAGDNTPVEKSDENKKELSPLEQLVYQWEQMFEEYYDQECQHDAEQKEILEENPDYVPCPFPKLRERKEFEDLVLKKILSYAPTDQPCITQAEFYAFNNVVTLLTDLDADQIKKIWSWSASFSNVFPKEDLTKLCQARTAHFLRKKTPEGTDPRSLGLPDYETVYIWLEEICSRESQSHSIMQTAGIIYFENGKFREAQCHLSRAFQLDRLNPATVFTLARLYLAEDRPKDAMAVIDLYCRSGGRHPGIFFQTMETAFNNRMPQHFLLYYNAYSQQQEIPVFTKCKCLWAYWETGQYAEALDLLNSIIGFLKEEKIISADETADAQLARAVLLARTGQDWIPAFEKALSLNDEDSCEQGIIAIFWDPSTPLYQYVLELPETDPRRLKYEQILLEKGLAPAQLFDPSVPFDDDKNMEGEECSADRIDANQDDNEIRFDDDDEDDDTEDDDADDDDAEDDDTEDDDAEDDDTEDDDTEDDDTEDDDTEDDDAEDDDAEDDDAEDDEGYGIKNLYRCVVEQPLTPDKVAFDHWNIISGEKIKSYRAQWFVLADSEDEAFDLALEMQQKCYPLEPRRTIDIEEISQYISNKSKVVAQGDRDYE